MNTIEDTSLDDLYLQAKAAMREQVKAKAKTPTIVEEDPDIGLYRNPANWIKGKAVALLHEETKTLLGHFTEYTHKTVPNCRRMVREDCSAPVESVEYIKGSWAPAVVPAARKMIWNTSVEVICDIRLLDFQTQASDIVVEAFFGEGRLERVELIGDVTFASPTQFFTLPAGTNIFPQMALASISNLLTQLEQE